MDFMNFMNQLNDSGCGNCGCDLNQGCGNSNNNFGNFGCGSGLLPLLLLVGLGQGFGNNNLSGGGNMTCYPNNQCQQFITPTSVPYCGSNLKYKTRRVRQAYMEVPVSTYQVAQPFCGINQQPTTMNIMPVGGYRNGNGTDLWTILLLLSLLNRNNRNMCCQPQPRGCNNVSSEL